MNIIILGAPGSGKGTIANKIKKELKINYISTGNIIRDVLQNNDKNTSLIKEYINNGKLIPNNIMLELIEKKINNTHTIIDGFPRDVQQAKFLLKKIKNLIIIILNIDELTILKRLKYRLTKYDVNYNIIYNNTPKIKNKDNITGETITKRNDDKIITIKTRIHDFNKNNEKIINLYKQKIPSKNFIEINEHTNINELISILKKYYN